MECATELTGFIMRIQGNIFYSRFSFELINFSLNIFYEFSYVSVCAMYAVVLVRCRVFALLDFCTNDVMDNRGEFLMKPWMYSVLLSGGFP